MKRERPALVVAALTALRAYIVAGRPDPLPNIGSFEGWGLVRNVLVWLGAPDPAATREQVMVDDPQKAALAELLALWNRSFGSEPLSLAELYRKAQESGHPGAQTLVAQLVASTTGHDFNPRSVGRYLHRHLDRIAGGLVLRAEKDSSGVARYRVAKLGGSGERRD